MNVLITGGAGFLGRRLIDKLLQRGTLRGRDGHEHALDRINDVAVEPSTFSAPQARPAERSGTEVPRERRRWGVRRGEAPRSSSDRRVRHVTGNIEDHGLLGRVIDTDTASIFHLAAVVSGMAEANFELGMRINIDASRALLDVCRSEGHCPKVVFTSSVAVYGGDLPEVVTDATALNPQSSYGTQKAMIELLVGDYTRRGFIDGRVLRLPTISVRPGQPNAAASSFLSGIIREPLSGKTSVCPVDPATRVWLSSPATAIDCLIAGHDLPSDALGTNRIVNLPGLSISVAEMVATLERIAGPEAVRHIRWERDPRVERIVASWPGAWDTSRARSLGFPSDPDFDRVVRDYINTNTNT